MSKWAEILCASGMDAYIVGGAMRDGLRGIAAKDEDFLVAGVSHSELRAAIIPHADHVEDLIVAGRKVGIRADGVEICPPRKEVSTGPGHKDFDIVCDKHTTVIEDLARRDFTVNAIAMNLATDQLVDPFHGAADLANGILRTVSPDAFRDDPLRILRGLVRVSKDDLTPDHRTAAQMEMHAGSIANLSGERVQAELCKVLVGDFAVKALRLARNTGVLAAMLPELAPMIGFNQESKYHDKTVDEHTFAAIDEAPYRNLRVRLALLFHDSGKPASAWMGKDGRLHYYANAAEGKRDHAVIGDEIAREALNRLRFPTAMVTDVCKLVEGHMLAPTKKMKKVRKLRATYGELLHDLFTVRFADYRAGGKSVDALAELCDLEELVELSVSDNDPVSVKDLAVNGNDLVAMGMQGREIGNTLNMLLDEVMSVPANNNRVWLLQRAKKVV